MFRVNVDQRASIEQVYPIETFLRDAGRNSVGNASVLHGLKIMSKPDADGAFNLTAAKHQAGEINSEGDTIFVPAFLAVGRTGDQGAAQGGQQSADVPVHIDQKEAAYASYIDYVFERARSADFKEPIGRDFRLAGFHGG